MYVNVNYEVALYLYGHRFLRYFLREKLLEMTIKEETP